MAGSKQNKNEYDPTAIESKWPHSAKASRGKQNYDPNTIEKHWQEVWEKDKTFSPDLVNAENPYYTLMMFPYPSAEGLHIGNMYAFTGADIHGRYMRMKGKDVFEPIGLDGFGIHSENYAIKVGKHPREQAKISEKNFYRQLRATGNGYDWTRTLETYDPLYYRWTQWIFVQMFKKGLAYRKKAQVNWCPSDKTVLADEQVIDGRCERDGAVVEKRDLEQWFFKITEYADALINGLNQIDWPDKIKIAQKQWIGKSEGARIKFSLKNIPGQPDNKHFVEVFTTRPDTLFGATFLVISPEIGKKWLDVGWKAPEEVNQYITKALKGDQAKRRENRKKTGVFTKILAINPVNNEEIPVWVADYVLAEYGTGAIMAVPAHDSRDFEFAKKYDLPIRQVIVPDSEFGKSLKELKEAYDGSGGLVNSGDWDDYAVPEAMPKILDYLEERKIGKRETTYHLRDWLISRQRYWGPPIPMIYCSTCEKNSRGEREDMPGWWTVPEDQLPVELPVVSDWRPIGTGASPLANHPEFYQTKCPSCGGSAKRETDVSDTFLDSAWYYLRYLSVGNQKSPPKADPPLEEKIKNQKFDADNVPYDIDLVKKWCPVAIYIGGAEHSVLHLLYVRFVAMVLHDLKNQLRLPFEEPFPRFFAHGLIIKERAKMSKSRGNIVIPDEYIEKYGADALRMYLMFLGPFSQGGDFRDSGIEGMHRFVKKVWKLLQLSVLGSQLSDASQSVVSSSVTDKPKTDKLDSENRKQKTDNRLRMMHNTIKQVTQDIESFSYNTAIARMMEWYNFLSEELKTQNSPASPSEAGRAKLKTEEAEFFLKLLAPFAPHFTEELFERLKLGQGTIHKSEWPKYDERYLVQDQITIVVQINGKRRGEVTINSSNIDKKDEIEKLARKEVEKYVTDDAVKKVVYVPGRIINFVI